MVLLDHLLLPTVDLAHHRTDDPDGGGEPAGRLEDLGLGFGVLLSMPIALFLVPCVYVIPEDLRTIVGRFRRPDDLPDDPEEA